jgi:hypothetical protein
MEHWTAAHQAFAVEAYFKNNESVGKTHCLFRRHFSINRNASVPTKNTIKSWVQNFRESAPAMKKWPPARP